MDKIHDLLSPWVGTHPVIAVLGALVVGVLIGLALHGKKKKD